jgi:hypothetical protein
MNLWIPSSPDSPDSPYTTAQSQLMWLELPAQGSLPAPEPASLAIWTLGLATAAGYRWRKRKGAAK